MDNKIDIERAYSYLLSYFGEENCSDVVYDAENLLAEITVQAKVNLPQKFIKDGITDLGVQEKEPVTFIFSNKFPFKAPIIKFRQDFPRCFPHINPNEKDVIPCIYEGDLSELLQTPDWMNNIIEHLMVWLERAAANDLIDPEQGWEPIRNDKTSFFIYANRNDLYSATSLSVFFINYNNKNEIKLGRLSQKPNKPCVPCFFYEVPYVINDYFPNWISCFGDLRNLVKGLGVTDFEKTIKAQDSSTKQSDFLPICLKIKRPYNLIGSNSNIEFLFFYIHKTGKSKKRKYIEDSSPVELANVLFDISPETLRRLSNTKPALFKEIAILGCGSLGSKVAVHLARNGNTNFICIDDDIFLPHNNARYGLTYNLFWNKSINVVNELKEITGCPFFSSSTKNIIEIDKTSADLILDTTGSNSVLNYLISKNDHPPIISSFLVNNGKSAFMLIESKTKATALSHIWAYIYHLSLSDSKLSSSLFSRQGKHIVLGQSCSSTTMIVDDATISSYAALMSLKLQNILEKGLNDSACFFHYSLEKYNIITSQIIVPMFQKLETQCSEWNVYILPELVSKILKTIDQELPKETGGVLLGSVFFPSKEIFITEIIEAPEDSVLEVSSFKLGINGLEPKVKSIEAASCKHIIHLGTWHSHPVETAASALDKATHEEMKSLRKNVPTCCLIFTKTKIEVLI